MEEAARGGAGMSAFTRVLSEVSTRDTVFATIRRSLGVTADDAARCATVAERLAAHTRGVIPQRGQVSADARVALFCKMIEAASATTQTLATPEAIPGAVSAYLAAQNLPLAVRRGSDPMLAALPWQDAPSLSVSTGPSDGKQLAAISCAFGAAAESGTLVLVSGADNPTTLNFLPDVHFVVLHAADIDGDYESVWARLRGRFGDAWPRTVNWISGPSRSADIEQTIILGAHGPRRLHVFIVP
jgi:L-lactate dehydrogenase complex protein LldG